MMDMFMSLSLISLPDFTSGEMWFSLITLTFLEIVLGVDNIIFITIAANKLPKEEQGKARNIGLILAMVFRVALLFGISWLISLQEPVLNFDNDVIHAGFSWQSIILFLGGVFLLYKATSEIHHKLEGDSQDDEVKLKSGATLTNIIAQIALINIVFSFDSILTAVGLTNDVSVMIIAVVVSVLIMMLFAGPVGNFVNEHPTIQMLGLAFLILIGFMLVAEAAHLGHAVILGSEVGVVPKGYLYFAIAFSLLVEFLNMRLRKKGKPLELHGIEEVAKEEGLLGNKTN